MVSRLAKPQTGRTNTDSRSSSLIQDCRCLERPHIDSSLQTRLLFYPQNRVLCRLGDSEFDDGLRRNLDLLLCLRIEADASLPFLLYELAKSGQDEFAILFDRFVGEVAERIEEYSSGCFVGLGGSSESDLKFSFVMSGRCLLHRNCSFSRL